MKRAILLLLLAAGITWYCGNKLQPPFRNLAPDVQYVGMETCRSCHAEIHNTFVHTGMGRSFGAATPDRSDATFGPHALVYDESTGYYYFPFFRDSALYVREFRLENGDTVYQREERIHYIVGSGQHTNSHIIDVNGYIYQAPITFYTQEGRWDMAPGFRDGGNLRFSRALHSECITCHNHFPAPVEGALNRFSFMPSGIECERCHGPGEIHVRERLAGQPAENSIVHPRHLPRDLQMDLCQRCHLQGVAVLAEGKTEYDFKPGMRLQDVMNVFLPRYTSSHQHFIMASQADRLRLSACYEQSDMSCITCHNPHQGVRQTSREQYDLICQSCHQSPCPDPGAAAGSCSGCHMPVSGSTDIPHVRITDHKIARPEKSGPSVAPAFLGLELLTKDEGTPLEMAQGYIALFEKYLPDPQMLDSAGFYLKKSREPAARTFRTRVHYAFIQKNYAALTKLAGEIPEGAQPDAWTWYRLGEGLLQTGEAARAESFFQKAVDELPLHLEFREKLGVAQILLNKPAAGKVNLEQVVGENPKMPVALCNLGYTHALEGDLQTAESLYDRALALDPDYQQALVNKIAVRLARGDENEAQNLVDRLLRLNPDHPVGRDLQRKLPSSPQKK